MLRGVVMNYDALPEMAPAPILYYQLPARDIIPNPIIKPLEAHRCRQGNFLQQWLYQHIQQTQGNYRCWVKNQ